jgi:uncharacterized membrane protein YhaH (DUF805 family)
MWMLNLLFSMKGRIGRRDWWIGTLTLFAATMAYYYVTTRLLGLTEAAANAGTLIFVYPSLALMLKRFADLEWAPWFAYALTAIGVAVHLFPMPDPADKPATVLIVGMIALVTILTEIVICGILKGKQQDVALRAQPA